MHLSVITLQIITKKLLDQAVSNEVFGGNDQKSRDEGDQENQSKQFTHDFLMIQLFNQQLYRSTA